jgi:hypothetical protein
MPQDGVMPEKRVWFCTKCRTKGKSFGGGITSKTIAITQHKLASKDCDGALEIMGEEEFEKSVNSDTFGFKNWYD